MIEPTCCRTPEAKLFQLENKAMSVICCCWCDAKVGPFFNKDIAIKVWIDKYGPEEWMLNKENDHAASSTD